MALKPVEIVQKEGPAFIDCLIKEENAYRDPITNDFGRLVISLDSSCLQHYETRIAQKIEGTIYIMTPPTNKQLGGIDPTATREFIKMIYEKLDGCHFCEVPFQKGYRYSLDKLVQQCNNGLNKPIPYYRNVMISGTPGCGKSYFVDKYAIPEIIGEGDDLHNASHVTRVVFTEGYT